MGILIVATAFIAMHISTGMPTLGEQEGQLPPLPSSMGAKNYWAFSGLADGLVHKNFSGGRPPDTLINIALQGDQHTKHCSCGKKFEDKNLPLWRNIHIHRCTIIGSLPPLP